MARPEEMDTGGPGTLAAFAIPALAQIAGIASGNEAYALMISAATAGMYIRLRWDAGAIVASGAAGLIITAAFFSSDKATADAAAHAAYWMVCAGLLALVLGQRSNRGGIVKGGFGGTLREQDQRSASKRRT